MMSFDQSVLSLDWLLQPEGRQVLSALSTTNGTRLRTYGLLERPVLPAHIPMDEVHYKLVVVGKGGVGKTSTVARLSGHSVPATHGETAGMQVTKMYWPVKIAHLNKPVLMNLTLWDTGEMAAKKFDHVLPACKSDVDGILFVFSFVDKGSWDEIPHLMTRLTEPGDKFAKIVLGTKFDLYAHSEVSQRDLREFENRWHIPVLKISNLVSHDQDRGLSDIAPVLNCVCENLWQRDVDKETHKA